MTPIVNLSDPASITHNVIPGVSPELSPAHPLCCMGEVQSSNTVLNTEFTEEEDGSNWTHP